MTEFQTRKQKPETRNEKESATLRKPLLFWFLLSGFWFSQAHAQSQYVPINPIPLGDTLLTLPTSHIPAEGTWEVKFIHRFNQSLDQGSFSDRVHSLFGLDSNADVGIGLSFAPRRDLQFSFLRSNALDDIEFAAKYIVIQQAPAIPLSAAVRAGVDWRTEQGLNDRTSFFGQLILSHQFGRRVEVFAMPTYVTKAGRAVVGDASYALFDHAANVPLGAAITIRPALSLVAEIVPKNGDLPDGTHTELAWAVGLKRAIGGHYFEILITNSTATHVDQYVTSTYMGAPLSRGDLHLGFNIERRFGATHQ
jgi:hypothetical protein